MLDPYMTLAKGSAQGRCGKERLVGTNLGMRHSFDSTCRGR
jgi:hypothetical protein